MCSSTRGPAIAPSLVTCPTSATAKPFDLASRISSKLHARTCPTVPGALSIVSSHIVWIESMTTSVASARRLQGRGDLAHVDGGGQLDRGVRKAEVGAPASAPALPIPRP